MFGTVVYRFARIEEAKYYNLLFIMTQASFTMVYVDEYGLHGGVGVTSGYHLREVNDNRLALVCDHDVELVEVSVDHSVAA